METIFFIQSECNDKGWVTGNYYYKNLADAEKSMRKYVAHFIRYHRSEGNKVEFFHIWSSTPIGRCKECNDMVSQDITFKVTKMVDGFKFEEFWDFRIFAAELRDKPLENERCFNF